MTTVGGELVTLRRTGVAAQEVGRELGALAARLGAELAALRAAPGTAAWVGDVPPLDLDAASGGARVGHGGAWVAAVADAIAAADRWGAPRRLPPFPVEAATSHGGVLRVLHDGTLLVDLDDRPQVVRFERGEDDRYVLVVETWDVPASSPGGRRAAVRLGVQRLDVGTLDRLALRLGGGDDVVFLPADLDVHLTVWAGAGDDVVGGAGPATPLGRAGGGGDDRLFGGAGDDVLLAGAGEDEVWGGTGDDVLEGQGGADLVVGGRGRDRAWGGRGRDRVRGNGGDDVLEGGSGTDDVAGGRGDDVLSGGSGEDRLHGDAGADVLLPGRGADAVVGGAGADVTHAQAEDRVSGSVLRRLELVGSPGRLAVEVAFAPHMGEEDRAAWQERLTADLDLLRQTVPGRRLLAALDAEHGAFGASTEVHAYHSDVVLDDAYVAPDVGELRAPGGVTDGSRYVDGRRDGESFSEVVLDAHHTGGYAPQVVLMHELRHALDGRHGGAVGRLVERRPATADADGDEVVRSHDAAEMSAGGYDVDGDGEPDPVHLGDGTAWLEGVTQVDLERFLGLDPRPSHTDDGHEYTASYEPDVAPGAGEGG